MKLKIKAQDQSLSLATHNIMGNVVNSFDLSEFPEGARFVGDDDTRAAGINDVARLGGVLHVTLGQCGLPYECQPTGGSYDWHGTGEWIDAEDYDPNRCYIVATSAPEGAEYIKRENGWTVALPQAEEEPNQ